VTKRAWLLYPFFAAVATLTYYATGHPSYLFNLIGLSSPILILVAVVVHKPEARAPWYLFAFGQFLFITGDVLAYNYEKIFGSPLPFPAISDVAYLLVYPCLVAGAIAFVHLRSPRRDFGALVDSAIVAIGIGTLSWVLLISPYAHDTSLTIPQKLVSMGYPLMDLMVLSVTVRLAMSAGRRAPAFQLMIFAVTALLVTDSLYGWLQLNGGYTPGSGLLEIGWISFYVVFGAAALHPSMRVVSHRQATPPELTVTPARLALLGGASLLAPIAQATQAFRHQPLDLPVVLGATIVLFLLAIVRMAGFVRLQQQSSLRERALREAGEALETATSRDGIYHATISAAQTLASEGAVVHLFVASDQIGSNAFALGAASTATAAQRFALVDVDDDVRDTLEAGHTVEIHRHGGVDDSVFLTDGCDHATVSPIFVGDQLGCLVSVASSSALSTTTLTGLDALYSQVALALESAVLTEELLVRQSEARFASLVKNSSDVIVLVDRDSTIRYASPSSITVLGYEPERLEETEFVALVHPSDVALVTSFLVPTTGRDHAGPFEFQLRCADDRYIHAEALRTNLERDPNVRGVVLNIRDVSERKSFEEQLSHQAFHDTLTGLANRALFQDRVAHAIERRRRDGNAIAVLFMDLDDFKTVNDSLGHAAGDELLRECGIRLRGCLRPADTPARLGGDEFAILLEDFGDSAPLDVADRIMKAFETPFHLDGKEVFVRASIGIATSSLAELAGDGGTDELLRNADIAMYIAKERGKARYQVFEPTMHQAALERLELKADLQRALEHKEFELHYQPIIELTNGEICGFEALIRWRHPTRGIVGPLDFIHLAEETGLIVPIGHWVLREACEFAAQLQSEFPQDQARHMAVNLSARQLQRPEVVDQVREALADTQLEPNSLILEITESAMITDMETAIERLTEFKALGVQLAIDDFGTGYSSLNYVRQFPVDILKVDKSFIDGLADEAPSSSLVATVLELARVLKLRAVAEGVEVSGQLERLQELNCELGQGYLFAKPLTGQGLRQVLRARRTAPPVAPPSRPEPAPSG
jgi:diguanylate cyclase (GGDEF)-like protein/PAS domain S-box-containing protein